MNTSISSVKTYLDSLDNLKTKKAMTDGLYSVLKCFGLYEPEDIYLVNWHELDQNNINAIRTTLSALYSPATVNLRLSALRGILKTCWRLGLIETDSYERLEIKDVKGERDQYGRMLEKFETDVIFQVCDAMGDEGLRNSAIFAIALQCGLRRDELSNLRFENYYYGEGRINLTGKGAKNRNVYVSGKAKAFLDRYIELRGDHEGWLFHPFSNHGKIRLHQHFGVQGLHDMLQKIMERGNLSGIMWHDFRRTFISTLLMNGVDPILVCKMAGQSDVRITMMYDRRPENQRKETFRTIDV